MATMVGTQEELTKFLIELGELEYDAIEAYKAAIERLGDVEVRRQMSSFLSDHERHVVEIDRLIRDFGATPPDSADIKQYLTKGKVMLGSLSGDRAILMAMKTNEDDTNTAYERAVARNDLPSHVRTVMAVNLSDERRHREWIERRISSAEYASSSR